jgi:hypothetical protein
MAEQTGEGEVPQAGCLNRLRPWPTYGRRGCGDEDKCVARGDYYDTLMDDNDYSSHLWVTAC